MTGPRSTTGGARRVATVRGPAASWRALVAVLVSLAVLLAAAAARADATTLTFTPDADATVRMDAPAKNQGRATSLGVRGGSRARRSILRFAVRLPRGQAVVSATLSLYALTRGFTGATEVRAVDARDWCERTQTTVRRGHGQRTRGRPRRCRGVTWRRQPRVRAGRVAAASGWAARTRVTFDVTSLVRRSGRVTLAITTSGSRMRAFASRQSRRTRRPRLIVVTAAPARPAPPPAASPAPPAVTHVVTAAGDYTGCQGLDGCAADNAARVRDVIAAQNPEVHLGIGDFQYQSIATIGSGFDLLYPRGSSLWSRIRPTAGPDHDVTSCTDPAYQAYWGRPAMQMYSFDVGAWHIISLPSAAVRYGCDVAGVTAALQADLAASAKRCTLAFWQDPYFTADTATHTPEAGVKPWVDALYAAGADIVVQASNHDYQRFAEQDPNRVATPGAGLRAFVVGTGGIGLYPFTSGAPNLEAANDTTWGVLRLDLGDDGTYSGRFIPAAGGMFSDAFSGRCH
jgi:acid phosphatase type 7